MIPIWLVQSYFVCSSPLSYFSYLSVIAFVNLGWKKSFRICIWFHSPRHRNTTLYPQSHVPHRDKLLANCQCLGLLSFTPRPDECYRGSHLFRRLYWILLGCGYAIPF